MTLKIEVLNPQARKLINALVEMNLINIVSDDESIDDVLNRVRQKVKKSGLTKKDINREVNTVRERMYEKRKKIPNIYNQGNIL